HRSHLFRFCELHDARLWRRHASATLASAWADDGDERRAAVWLVDRRDLRGLADDADGERRWTGKAGETLVAWIAARARTCRAATRCQRGHLESSGPLDLYQPHHFISLQPPALVGLGRA